jgi:SMI1 / KNR4 family (SUKH-1)
MTGFRQSLNRIRAAQSDIRELVPYRDIEVVPNPGASPQAIALAEERLGRTLPASYRAFLLEHDGWPRFFEGASLLGTATLGKRFYEDIARGVFEAAETPVPDLGPLSRPAPRIIVPFGADLQGTTLFAFNPTVCDPRGEWEVVAWVNELGVRRDNFEEFLEFVAELCESELEGHRSLLAESA